MKDSVILYTQQYESIKGLSLEDKGFLLDAIFHYVSTGNILESLPPLVEMAFSFIRTAIDIDSEKYQKRCKKNQENIRKRWNESNKEDTNVYDCIPKIQTNTSDTDTDTDTDTENDNESIEKDSSESSPTHEKSDFEKFNDWIKEHAPYCSNPQNFTKQLTEDEFRKLKEKYTGTQIADTILQIENRKDLRKKYTHLYRTVLNWTKNEYGVK